MVVDQETLAFFDDRYDSRYRKIEDCDNIKADTADKLKDLSLDIVVIKTKLTILQWIGSVVGAAVIGIAIKYLFGG